MRLLIDACVRHASRTRRLAQGVLDTLGGCDEAVVLSDEPLQPLNEERLELRSALAAKGDFSHPMFRWARQFARADEIVIAAPYWDLSFPALLKIYLENIYVVGLVSAYDAQGIPRGLCRAKRLIYVTTAGGRYFPQYGFETIEKMARECFGIPDVRLIFAENLDIFGADAEAILHEAVAGLSGKLK